MKRLTIWCVYGALTMLVAAAGLGGAPDAQAQEVPFTAVVHDEEVTIRSGAGRAYYSVGTLKKGDIVVVEELFHGWNKIKPPEGVYSYISKAFVNAEGDGSTGVVNRDRAEVKAANVKGPGTLSYRIIKELNKGDTVRIVAEENGWYKIEPLTDTYVFLEPGSVRRASAVNGATEPVEPEQPVEPVTPTEPMEEPVEPTEPVTPTEPIEPSEPAEPVAPTEPAEPLEAPTEPTEPTDPAEPIEPTDPAEPREPGDGEQSIDLTQGKGDTQPIAIADSDDLATVDKQMLPHFEKPLEEQPIDQMIAAYRKFESDESLTPTDKRLVRLRLAALEHNKKVLAAIQRTNETLTEIQSARQEQEQIDANTFDAVGILMASNIYDGKNMPRMYRLVDPTTRRARAYITPTAALDANAALGRLVGVRGPSSFDSAAKLTVIEPTRVTILEALPE